MSPNLNNIDTTYNDIWLPAMKLLPKELNSKEAAQMALTIGLQESRLVYRHQIGGPAHGLWQFEKGGGVKGVLTHKATAWYAKEAQKALQRGVGISDAYGALEHDDALAAVFARLLLYSDQYRLPEIGQTQRAWNLYLRTWRPGKPHEKTWPGYYKEVQDYLETK